MTLIFTNNLVWEKFRVVVSPIDKFGGQKFLVSNVLSQDNTLPSTSSNLPHHQKECYWVKYPPEWIQCPQYFFF
jgi:hypothetical protein